MRIALASDHVGHAFKQDVVPRLQALGYQTDDCGCYSDTRTDYARFTIAATLRVLDGKSDVALFACGNGYAMAMLANRLPGMRAAVCHDVFTARTVREMGDANAIAIGTRVVAPGLAWHLLCTFIESSFRGDREPRYRRRLEQVSAIECAVARPDWRLHLQNQLNLLEHELPSTNQDQSR